LVILPKLTSSGVIFISVDL